MMKVSTVAYILACFMLQLLIASWFPAAKLYKNSEIYIVLPVILIFFRAMQRISPAIQNMFEKKYKLLQILIFHNHAFIDYIR